MKKLPPWLKQKIPSDEFFKTSKILKKAKLKTVCEEALCPNRFECFNRKTATFLALGKNCTRHCSFCNISHNAHPTMPDPLEPSHILDAIKELKLKHVVITMVTRDDLIDGGAHHMAKIIEMILNNTKTSVEVLTSDFKQNMHNLEQVLKASPTIFNHNLETVRRLSPTCRHIATYQGSLKVLSHAHNFSSDLIIKSGIMVGLGETKDEVLETLNDLKNVGCQIVTIGQYLQPSKKNLPVKEFIPPDQFFYYKEMGQKIGIKQIISGPFVRSSYKAESFINH
ncbi:MAG TPA: lipoyl synthase [Chlamydiales bacterium]|nr:lipoyl synthase [Chlamydiales bacterium]